MRKNKPFCVVPFVEGFSGTTSQFRNCCVTDPQISSLPGHTFSEWWQDPRRIAFAESQWTDSAPPECYRCTMQEQHQGTSFRTSVNNQVEMSENFGHWPSRWNIKFGNICNLACWTCSENASSVIAQHKKIIDILPENYVDPELEFKQHWPALEKNILKSYDYHSIVTLTIIGGEPLYNKKVIDFLSNLKDLGLAPRTRLEFHTNGTKINSKLFADKIWNYICVFLSFDAVGRKAEWLRYGTRWSTVESNLEFFKQVADYLEVQCTLSILNVGNLSSLDQFCKLHGLPLKIMLLSNPDYMSILKWPGDKALIIDNDNKDNQFDYYYNLIGSNPDNQSIIQLKNYIIQFNSIRHNLSEYDPRLARALGLD